MTDDHNGGPPLPRRDQLLDAKAVARELGVSIWTVRRWAAAPNPVLRFHKIGGRWRALRSDVEKLKYGDAPDVAGEGDEAG